MRVSIKFEKRLDLFLIAFKFGTLLRDKLDSLLVEIGFLIIFLNLFSISVESERPTYVKVLGTVAVNYGCKVGKF